MAAGDAGVDALDLAVRHQLGFFQGLLNALHRGVDVDHHTALETIAGCHTQPGQLELATGQDFGDHGHDLGCANVQAHHHVFVFSCHISFCPSWFFSAAHCLWRHRRTAGVASTPAVVVTPLSFNA